MKKKEVVKSKDDFNNIINRGKKIKNRYYNIFTSPVKSEIPLFGLAVSKKHGNAVMRNKIKRQLRNIIDDNKNCFEKNTKYIIMIKKEGTLLEYAQKEANLVNLFTKGK